MMQSVHILEQLDQWSYIWGNNQFTSRRAYKVLIGSSQVHQVYKWLWETCCQNKRNFFFWLLLKDRLSTRELLRRKHMFLQDYNCVFCSYGVEESLSHLFFDCPFAQACWNTLNLMIPVNCTTEQIIETFKLQLHLPYFMEVIITMCWAIWTCRNDVIFRNIPATVRRCKMIFKSEFALVILRAKSSFHPSIDLWLESYV